MLSATTNLLLLLLLSLHRRPANSISITEHLQPVSLAGTAAGGSCTPHIVVNDFLSYDYLTITPSTAKGELEDLMLTVTNQLSSCSVPNYAGYITVLSNCSMENFGPIRIYPVPCSVPELSRKTQNYYYSTTVNTDLFELNCTTLVYSPFRPFDGRAGNSVRFSVYVSWKEKENEDAADSSENCVTSADSPGGFCRYKFSTADLEDCRVQGKHINKLKKQLMIGGLAVSGIIVILLIISVSLCCYRKLNSSSSSRSSAATIKRSRKERDGEEFIEKFQNMVPERFSYSDVEKITSCFSDKLGQGGYGSVYRGQLEDGRPVAVKVLTDSKHNVRNFFSEVISIGCTYHVNIVALLGFCYEGPNRVLIYEFMANGSLGKFISHRKSQASPSPLDVAKLLEIATGVARGLEYLHHGCNVGILHLDIKPQNILLDDDLRPKIADFGLAKLCRSAQSRIKMRRARGTVGYMAPEVFSRQYGEASSKSDVYSFGMMVLEMVGGGNDLENEVDRTSELCFPHWICRHLDADGNLKTSMRASTADEEEMAGRMVVVGLQCVQMKPSDRPTMTKVLDMLEGRVTELQMPPMGSVAQRFEVSQFPETVDVSASIAHISEDE